MHHPRGFSLFELLTVVFMIALVSAIAVPNVISWRSAARLKSTVENLKGSLELAKMKAIQENGPVAVHFRENEYTIFVDTGATAGIQDADEPLLKKIRLPQGVKIDFTNTKFPDVDGQWPKKARFFGRGTAKTGSVVLTNKTDRKKVTVSSLGRITITDFNDE